MPEDLVKASKEAVDLIKQWEGCSLDSYQDAKGKWAVGYGQNGQHIGPGMRILQSEADQWLANHVAELQEQMTKLITVPITQKQFDALVSLVYNIGIGAFANSTLLKKLNTQHYDAAGMEILRWTHSHGVELEGLVRRRSAEYRLYQEG
jgi:lysozyme